MLNYEEVHLGAIKVVGPAILTSNEKEMTQEGQMIELYEHFVHSQVSQRIKNKKNDRIIALYTDYESDESSDYIYAIGHEVTTSLHPDDMEYFEIPAGRYLHIASERGYLNDILPSLWREIWRKTQSGELPAERAFTTDLEFHNYEDNTSPEATVDIYLSIR